MLEQLKSVKKQEHKASRGERSSIAPEGSRDEAHPSGYNGFKRRTMRGRPPRTKCSRDLSVQDTGSSKGPLERERLRESEHAAFF